MSKKIDLEHLLGFSHEEIATCCEESGLLSIELEFTRKCNLRCLYCYSSAGAPAENELSMDELKNVVDQAKEMGAKKIILLGGGEPLLYDGLEEIIKYINSIGLQQIIFTNGTLIDRKIAQVLLHNNVSVIIKHNSLDPAVQDMLSGVSGTYEKIKQGLKLLIEAGYPESDLTLGIQTVVCSQNIDELPSIWTWARENNLVPYVEILTQQGRARENRDLYVSPSDIREVFERLESIDGEKFGITWKSRPTIAAFSCRRHLYSCLVNSQGNVQPCTGVDIPVGSIRRNQLKEILRNSPVISKLRNVYEHLEGHCRECEYAPECYGCRGNAYQITGNYLASDPTCWYCEKLDNEKPACLCQQ